VSCWRRRLVIGIVASLMPCLVPALSAPANAVMGGEPAAGEAAVVPLTMRRGDGTWTCSGVLWRPRLVLTSAHCVTDGGGSTPISPSNVTVGLPGSVRGDGSPLVSPTIILQPPDFVNGEFVAPQDFAVLVLAADLAPTDVTRLATFAEVESWAAARGPLELVGYGRIGPQTSTNQAHRASFPISRSYPWGSSTWVELEASVDRGSCPGDSGGAYFTRLSSGARLLVAIHAGGWSPCRDPNTEGQYRSVGILPMSYPTTIEQALALAGYPQIPSSPLAPSAATVSTARTVVSWTPPERHPDAITGYSVAGIDGTVLCIAPASATSCDIQPAVPAGAILVVGATNALSEIAATTVSVFPAPMRRLDVERRLPSIPDTLHELRVCVEREGPVRLAERRDGRWTPVAQTPTTRRSALCPKARPHLAAFAWSAPPLGGSNRVELRIFSRGTRPIDFTVTIRP
jgi:hypothetical protein